MVSRSWTVAVTGIAAALAACVTARVDGDSAYERHLALTEIRGRARFAAVAAEALRDPDWRVAATACALAVEREASALARPLQAALEDPVADDPRLEHLLRALGHLGEKRQAAAVREYLRHARPAVRAEALRALLPERLGSSATVGWVAAMIHDRDPRVRDAALNVLHWYPDREARVVLAARGRDLVSLAALGATEELLAGIKAAPAGERRALLEGVLRAPRVRPFLLRVLEDPALELLHGPIVAFLRQRGDATPEVRRAEAAAIARWAPRIAAQVARCATADWYAALSQLKRWTAKPELEALRTGLAAGEEECRRGALVFVGEDVAALRGTRR